MRNRKRIKWLDFARGISILFVVLGHSIDSICYSTHLDALFFNSLSAVLFTVAMPCFFAISGYLYKPINNIHSYLLMIYKKIISLGFPYIIFSVIYVFMQNCGGNNIRHFNSYNNLFYIYKTPISYMWFLYALFFMFIITGLLDLFNINSYVQMFIYFMMMIMSILWPHLLPSGMNSMCNDIVYFYIGYIISTKSFKQIYKYILININLSKRKSICLLITLFIILFSIQSLFTPSNLTNVSTFSDFFTKIISILLLVQLSSQINYYNELFKYFNKYGKVTLIIYLIHWPVISISRIIFLKIIPMNEFTVLLIYFIIIILAWYSSIIIYYLSKHLKIINFIFYPRKKYISKLIVKTKFGQWLLDC